MSTNLYYKRTFKNNNTFKPPLLTIQTQKTHPAPLVPPASAEANFSFEASQRLTEHDMVPFPLCGLHGLKVICGALQRMEAEGLVAGLHDKRPQQRNRCQPHVTKPTNNKHRKQLQNHFIYGNKNLQRKALKVNPKPPRLPKTMTDIFPIRSEKGSNIFDPSSQKRPCSTFGCGSKIPGTPKQADW